MGDIGHFSPEAPEPPRILRPMEAERHIYGGEVIRATDRLAAGLPSEMLLAEVCGRQFQGRMEEYQTDAGYTAYVYSGTFLSRHEKPGAPAYSQENDFRLHLGAGLIIALHDNGSDDIEYWHLDRRNRNLLHAHSTKITEALTSDKANDRLVALCQGINRVQPPEAATPRSRIQRILGRFGLK